MSEITVTNHEPAQGDRVLRIGVCSEIGQFFEALLFTFDKLYSNSELAKIQLTILEDHTLLFEQALDGKFDVISPDSTLRIQQFETAWQAKGGKELKFVKEYTVFAVSPIVLVMRSSIARQLGFPKKSIHWESLANLPIYEGEQSRWSRPSLQCGVGLLTTFAELYVATQKSDGITEEDLSNPNVISSIRALERTVAEYGPSAEAVAARAIQDGKWGVGAFVVPEQLALQLLSSNIDDPPVIVYPEEGTLWVEHALVFCSADQRPQIRSTFEALQGYLLSEDAQARVLSYHFRPAGSHFEVYLKTAHSRPLQDRYTNSKGVIALTVPSPLAQQYVSKIWRSAKRHTNVFLVVDTSGSMQGEKLSNAQRGMEAFITYLSNNQESVGIFTFSNTVNEVVPLQKAADNLQLVLNTIYGLRAHGGTAILDAIFTAYQRLIKEADPERIQAIVVLTDGHENESRLTNQNELLGFIASSRQQGIQIMVYCIAYGTDADIELLRGLTQQSSGAVYQGTLDNIHRVYQDISRWM